MYADIVIYFCLSTVSGLIGFSGIAGAAAGLAIATSCLFAGLLVLDVSRLIAALVHHRNQAM